MDLDSIGKSIIDEANPAGFDVRDTEQFSLIQDEYAKLTNPSATTPPDPAVIVRNATELLTNKGKDITVAIYLVNGLMRQNGLAGLAQGLLILGDIIENFWESLYPPLARIRGRRNSIQWLVDQTSKQLETTTYDPQPFAVCDNLKNQVQRVDQLISTHDEEAPGLFRLLSLIEAIPLLPEPEPDPTTTASSPVVENRDPSPPSAASEPLSPALTTQNTSVAPSSTTAPPQQAHTPPVALQSPKTVEEAAHTLCACQRNLYEVSDIVLSSDLSNPLPYRLVRASAWVDIFELPPHTNLKTLIPAPKSQLRDMLSAAQGSQSWQNLVQICESNISNSIFWLDLHRLSDYGLSKVGASCDKARAEISMLVSNFVQRFPEVTTLRFNDGTPFADDSTLQWLSGISRPSQNSASLQSSSETDEELTRVFSKARGLMSDGATSKALSILSNFIQHSQSERLKLRCRIELCEAVLKIQPMISAAPYAEAILTTVETHKLATWDPELAIAAFKSIYKAFIRTPSQTTYAEEIISKLAALDPAAAYQAIQEAS
jgi:type VI secretion system protein VasJ